jgi:hypothetical protein
MTTSYLCGIGSLFSWYCEIGFVNFSFAGRAPAFAELLPATLLAGCGDLPALDERTVTRTLDDLPGSPLARAIAWRAAERGVGVRLLVDDNGIAGLDPELRALDVHPNFEVRLYNAFTQRRFKFLGYLTHFRRLNRHMHN